MGPMARGAARLPLRSHSDFMPYGIKKVSGGRQAVYNKDTGKVYGRHPSREKAVKQIAAIEANTGGEGESKEK